MKLRLVLIVLIGILLVLFLSNYASAGCCINNQPTYGSFNDITCNDVPQTECRGEYRSDVANCRELQECGCCVCNPGTQRAFSYLQNDKSTSNSFCDSFCGTLPHQLIPLISPQQCSQYASQPTIPTTNATTPSPINGTQPPTPPVTHPPIPSTNTTIPTSTYSQNCCEYTFQCQPQTARYTSQTCQGTACNNACLQIQNCPLNQELTPLNVNQVCSCGGLDVTINPSIAQSYSIQNVAGEFCCESSSGPFVSDVPCTFLNYAIIRGVITDASTRNPLEASIFLDTSAFGSPTAVSNSNGEYEIYASPGVEHRLIFRRRPLYKDEIRTISASQLRARQVYELNVALTTSSKVCDFPSSPKIHLLEIQNIKCKDSAILSWDNDFCENDEGVSNFIITNEESGETYVIDGNKSTFTINDLSWDSNKVFSITAFYDDRGQQRYSDKTFSEEFFTGNEQCKNSCNDNEFCVDNRLRRVCDEKNILSDFVDDAYYPDCSFHGQEWYCSGPYSDGKTKCLKQSQCGYDLSIPFLGLLFNDMLCSYEISTQSYAKGCYMDSSTVSVDFCYSCPQETSENYGCSLYKSEYACTNNRCGIPSNCEWEYNEYEDFGKGICFDAEQKSDLKKNLKESPSSEKLIEATNCNLCSKDGDLFFNTKCNQNICSSLGFCYEESESCTTCSMNGTDYCNKFKTRKSCSNATGASQSFEIVNGTFIYSDDACGLGTCYWDSFQNSCYKDSDGNKQPDCSESSSISQGLNIDCEKDNTPPTTTPEFNFTFLNKNPLDVKNDLLFSTSERISNFYYCIGANNCSNFIPKGSAESEITINPIRDFGSSIIQDGVYLLRFYSVDLHKNREEIRAKSVYADTTTPQLYVTNLTECINCGINRTNNFKISFKIRAEENVACNDYLISQGETRSSARNKNTFALDVFSGRQIIYSNLNKTTYNHILECKDAAGNLAVINEVFQLQQNYLMVTLGNPQQGVSPTQLLDLTFETNRNAECRYSNIYSPASHTSYSQFSGRFDITGQNSHIKRNFQINSQYPSSQRLFVWCNSDVRQSRPQEFNISYDTTLPLITASYVEPSLVTEIPLRTNLFASTDDETMCRYDCDSSIVNYNSMRNNFAFGFSRFQNATINVQDHRNYSCNFACRNRAGLTSAVRRANFTVDTAQLPSLQIISPRHGAFFSRQNILLLVASQRIGECTYRLDSRNTTSLGPIGRRFNVSLGALELGSHSVIVSCLYGEGQSSQTSAFVVDTTPPSNLKIEDGNNSCVATNLTFSWHASDNESGIAYYRYRIFADNNSVYSINISNKTSNENVIITLPGVIDGKFFTEVIATNKANLSTPKIKSDGLIINRALSACKERIPPTVTLDIDEQRGKTIVAISCEDSGSSCKPSILYGTNDAQALCQTNFTYIAPIIIEQPSYLCYKAEDQAGNIASGEVKINVSEPSDEVCAQDLDCDNIQDEEDDDIDNDGANNCDDEDDDNDLSPDYDLLASANLDEDDDNDGVTDVLDYDFDNDFDEDTILNSQDEDDDCDSKTDCDDEDDDNDGILDNKDDDDDNDGILDISDLDNGGTLTDCTYVANSPETYKCRASSNDLDGDGLLNSQDDDIDGDGLKNNVDEDVDNDGVPNCIDQDNDNDGISDSKDADNSNDFDSDGMPNDWERRYGLNPLFPGDANGDIDGDGLNNLEEFKQSTDPTNKDTDGDGYSDYDELNKYEQKYDPTDPESHPPSRFIYYIIFLIVFGLAGYGAFKGYQIYLTKQTTEEPKKIPKVETKPEEQLTRWEIQNKFDDLTSEVSKKYQKRQILKSKKQEIMDRLFSSKPLKPMKNLDKTETIPKDKRLRKLDDIIKSKNSKKSSFDELGRLSKEKKKKSSFDKLEELGKK